MIWKTIILLSIALCVLGDGHHAVSEQWIKIIHKEHKEHKEHHGHHGELSHIGSKKPEHHEEYAWSYPSYEFSYKVHDPHTHDMKGQHESRHGDEVKGEYWLVQPDGHKRTVTYHADKHSGFHATVHYSDDHHHLEEHKKEEEKSEGEGEGGEKGEEAEEGEGGNEAAPVEEEVDEGRDAEESHGHEEEVGKWIHDRFWGHRGLDRHRDDKHHDHKHDHRGDEKRRDEHHNEKYHMVRGDDKHYDNRRYGEHLMARGNDGHRHEEHRHKDMSVFTGLGSYGRRDNRERAEWHGHDDRRDKDHEESRGHPEHQNYDERDALPKHKSGPIVRENYYHPRYYRQSQLQRKNIKH